MWVPGGQGKMEGIFPPTVTFLVTQEEMGRELDGQGGWVGPADTKPGIRVSAARGDECCAGRASLLLSPLSPGLTLVTR